MQVWELMEELEQMDPETEVRIAHQPSWPFEYSISSVIVSGGDSEPCPDAQDFEVEEDYEDTLAAWQEAQADGPREGVVYIAEGSQIGYLPSLASRQLNWR